MPVKINLNGSLFVLRRLFSLFRQPARALTNRFANGIPIILNRFRLIYVVNIRMEAFRFYLIIQQLSQLYQALSHDGGKVLSLFQTYWKYQFYTSNFFSIALNKSFAESYIFTLPAFISFMAFTVSAFGVSVDTSVFILNFLAISTIIFV